MNMRLLRAATIALAGATVISSIAVSVDAEAAPSRAPFRHALGLRPTAHTRAVAHPRAERPATAVPPAAVDLTPWTVPVGDQGAVSSCVTWAIDYAMLGWYSRRQGHPGEPFAPMYAYSQILAKYGWSDQGADVADAYAIAQDQGIDSQADYPQGALDWRDLPTPAQHLSAASHKTVGAQFLYATWPQPAGAVAQPAIEGAIASGHPVALSIPVYTTFEQLSATNSLMTAADATGNLLGYHEVLVVGYDPRGVRIQNSWGTSWGDHGFADLSWDFVADDSLDASVMSGFADAPADGPAVSTVDAASGPAYGGTSVTVHGLGFTGATAVMFGATPAAQITAIDGYTVTAIAPPAAGSSTVDVRVTTPQGTSAPTSADVFTYLPPAAPSVAPPPVVTRIKARGHRFIDIWGRGLATARRVMFGSRPGRIVGARSDRHLRVAVPRGSGRVRLRVSTAYGRSVPKTFRYGSAR